jgi:hypothetical protein
MGRSPTLRSLPLAAAALALLLLPACSRDQAVSTSGVEAAFEVVADTNRVRLDRLFAKVHDRQYAQALLEFRELRRVYKLTPSQEIAVQDMITELEERVRSNGSSPQTAVIPGSGVPASPQPSR